MGDIDTGPYNQLRRLYFTALPVEWDSASSMFFNYFLTTNFNLTKISDDVINNSFRLVSQPRLGFGRKRIVGNLDGRDFCLLQRIATLMFEQFPSTLNSLKGTGASAGLYVILNGDGNHLNMESTNLILVPRWVARQVLVPYIFGTTALDRRYKQSRILRSGRFFKVFMGHWIRHHGDEFMDKYMKWPKRGLLKSSAVPLYNNRKNAEAAYQRGIEPYLRMLVEKKIVCGCRAQRTDRPPKLILNLEYFTFRLSVVEAHEGSKPKFKLLTDRCDMRVDMLSGFSQITKSKKK